MTNQAPNAATPAGGDATTVGERRHFYFNDAGQPAYQVIDLTPTDFLNPLPDDNFYHGELHDRTARILGSMLHHHYRYSPNASVHLRPKIKWLDPTLDQPMPDVAVVNALTDQHRHRPIIDLAEEQNLAGEGDEVAVRAIFEVTSPHLAAIDLQAKHALYARAGVREYWVFDTGLRPQIATPNFALLGWRLVDEQYEPIALSADGRYQSKACRLWLAVAADRQGFHIGDMRTGKPLPMPAEDDDPSISAQAEANRRAQSIAGQLKL